MSLPNIQSFDNLGGELADYSPVTDPTTDLSAESSNEMRADLAAMTRTCDKAWFSFTVSGGAIFIASTDYDAVYGNANIYKPTGVYNHTGDYTFTLPASIVDARGNVQYLNLKCGSANVAEPAFVAVVNVTSANTLDVYVTDIIGLGYGNPSGPTVKVSVFLK